jgi:hypothetical protein
MFGNGGLCICGNISVTGTSAQGLNLASFHDYFQQDPHLPILQIHREAISIANLASIQVSSSNHHQLDVICTQCKSKLAIHASRRGAYCQFSSLATEPIPGTLPTEAVSVANQVVPASFRSLFKQREVEDAINKAKSNEDDPTDFEMMFGRTNEPFVGSYSEVGKFVTEGDL